jgi:hypothetical protein
MSTRRGLTIGAIVATALLMLFATVSTAAGATRFGSKLTNDVQPSNGQPPHSCIDPADPPFPTCTWVMGEAYQRANGGHKAPRNGTIDKVRVIACEPGSFRLQLAKLKPALERAKIVRNGPQVQYQGDPDGCDDEVYKVSVVNVPNFHINKGEVIAIKTKRTGALRCSSGGDNIFEFYSPPLPVGGNFRDATGTDGCWLLVELQYTN